MKLVLAALAVAVAAAFSPASLTRPVAQGTFTWSGSLGRAWQQRQQGPQQGPQQRRRAGLSMVSSPPEKKEETEEPMLAGVAGPVSGGQASGDEAEGLPWWWEYFWKLPFTRRGDKGEPLTLGDTMHVFRTNIEQVR